MTLVLYYHELSERASPLCVSPELFGEHLRAIELGGATTLTAGELAAALRRGDVPERAVVITFDDGFAAAVREARPRLDARGMRATFYCVADHLGGMNDWPTQPPETELARLAGAKELAALAGDGHEIGAHGWSHAPLDVDADLERELVDAPARLAAEVGVEITTLAYPYGATPTPAARALVEETYSAAFGTAIGRVQVDSPLWNLPRVDAHYLRNPRLLRRAVAGNLDLYLGARRLGSQTRRAFRKDYVLQRAEAAAADTTAIGR